MEYHPASSPTLYIGNLTKDIHANKLHRHFSRFGDIVELVIKSNGRNKDTAYALCHYAETSSAVRAMQQMDSKLLGSKRIMMGFRKLQPTNYVWVAGVAEEVTAADLYLQCSQFGAVERVTIDKFRELALVHFFEQKSAEIAVSELRGAVLQESKLQADFATEAWREDFFELLVDENADIETCAESDTQENSQSIAEATDTASSQGPEQDACSVDDHNYTNIKVRIDSEGSDSLEYELMSILDEDDETLKEPFIKEDSNVPQDNVAIKSTVNSKSVKQKMESQPKSVVASNVNSNSTKTPTKKRTRKRPPPTADANFRCSFCQAAFHGRAQLSNHINHMHPTVPKPEPAPQVELRFSNSVPDKHFCEWCPYWTYQKGSLTLHTKRLHANHLQQQQSVPTEASKQSTSFVVETCSCINSKSSPSGEELVSYSPTYSAPHSPNSRSAEFVSQPSSPDSTDSTLCFILVNGDDETV